jgi:hypothetical protein
LVSSQPEPHARYIPFANPFVTKLAALTTDVAAGPHPPDVLAAAYLEPYGPAAALASTWSGVLFGIRHAGSDIGRLMQSAQLRTAYPRVLTSADFVVGSDSTVRTPTGIGVDQRVLHRVGRSGLPTRYFHPGVEPLDVDRIRRLRHGLPPGRTGEAVAHLLDKPIDAALPSIGIYGKIGYTKGSFDLIRALGELRRAGHEFNFLAMCRGNAPMMGRFVAAVEAEGLGPCTWPLPFIPHWLVPRFIRACAAVCFLERDLPIAIHNPSVPRATEIGTCGRRDVGPADDEHPRFVEELVGFLSGSSIPSGSGGSS